MTEDVGLRCKVCGKRLEVQPCQVCGGSGHQRVLLAEKRPCASCAGTGQVNRCADWARHLIGKPVGTRSVVGRTIFQGAAKPMGQVCPLCKGTRGVRHPMTGQVGPCPRCKGTGRV